MAVAAVVVGLGCPPVWKQGPAGGGGGAGGLGAGRPIKRAEGITHGPFINHVCKIFGILDPLPLPKTHQVSCSRHLFRCSSEKKILSGTTQATLTDECIKVPQK